MLEIAAVPAFSDNYIWLVHDQDSGETAIVDPGDAAPAIEEAQRRGWLITQVWNTHWHPDHTGGNLAIRAETGASVSGPAAETIAGRDVPLAEGSELRIGGHAGYVMEIPGHTLGHIALVFDEDRIAFVGDTLFAMGCGRLFEGTAEQMFNSLQRIAGLAPDTALYCGHEYTLANGLFAVTAERENQAIRDRLEQVRQQREADQITLPTTVSAERETNPFVRAKDWQELARLREAKDRFRS
jgi:hydroxyacylglutathione hydrolase